jgi:hypothetical protein
MTLRILLIALALASFLTASLVTRTTAQVASTVEEHYGCTYMLREFKKKYQEKKYAAFAKGRAFSITGMVGCGSAWNQSSQAKADKVAMVNCRKQARNPDKCYISHRTK